MNIHKLYSVLEAFEVNVAQFYHKLETCFADQPHIAQFFSMMKKDEIQHKNMIKYQLRLLRQNKSMTADVDVDPLQLDEINKHVLNCTQALNGPSLQEALILAMGFESNAAEEHLRFSLRELYPECISLLENLSSSDRTHVEVLEAFAREHDINLLR